MPWTIVHSGDQYCVHKEKEDGTAGKKLHCYDNEADAKAYQRALYANVEDAAAKYWEMVGVKAVGDWEIDITALPYMVRDSDGQWFDAETDTMPDNFPTPAIFYHHSLEPGSKSLQDKPVIIGKAISVEKKADGLHIRAVLDQAVEYARRVWEAVKQGAVAVSSDSIAHLARLEVEGRRIMYEKKRPGRIAVWPLAGVSLWDVAPGNLKPASWSATARALPAMKAIYREAGLVFPDIDPGTTGAPQADEMARKRAEAIKTSKKILKRAKKLK